MFSESKKTENSEDIQKRKTNYLKRTKMRLAVRILKGNFFLVV
jgi:hypothetical protein